MNMQSSPVVTWKMNEQEAKLLLRLCCALTENDVDGELYDFVQEVKDTISCYVGV